MPDPLVVLLSQRFKQELRQREAESVTRLSAAWLRVEQALNAQIDALAFELDAERQAGKSASIYKLQKMERYQALLAQLQQEVERYNAQAAQQIATGQRTFAQLAADHAAQQIIASTDGLTVAFNRLPREAVEQFVGLSGSGSPLAKLLQNVYGEAALRMTDQLLKGVALGKNPRETARLMRQGLAGGNQRALTIARTETQRVYRMASEAAYRESGVVSGFVRLPARDSRTCPACLMDDRIYNVGTSLPEHPNGRCTLIPQVDGAKPLRFQTGADWFRQQDAATQREILGPQRYHLWKQGRVDLDQFVRVKRDPTWGDSIQPATVAALT